MSTPPALAETPHVAKPFHAALVAHGQVNEQLFVVTNDLTASCEADGFRDAFPNRYLSAGMAEQALVGALAGLAREGLQPLYPTFAVFATRRPYEQVALTVAYPALPVRLFGFLPGLTTPGGVTHQATDDLGLMCQLPNMTVIEAADAMDMSTVLDAVRDRPGPVYVRGLRGLVPRLFAEPLRIGQSRRLARGDQGDEVLVIVAGHLTAMTWAVVTEERARFPGLGAVCVSTLKPFGDDELIESINGARVVITVADHLLCSGLGAAVSAHVARVGGPRVVTIGIRDTFTHGGSPDYLQRYYGIDADHVRQAIAAAFGRADETTRAGADRNDGTGTGPALTVATGERPRGHDESLTPAVAEGL